MMGVATSSIITSLRFGLLSIHNYHLFIHIKYLNMHNLGDKFCLRVHMQTFTERSQNEIFVFCRVLDLAMKLNWLKGAWIWAVGAFIPFCSNEIV